MKRISAKYSALLALVILLPIPSLGVMEGMLWFPDSTWGNLLFMLSKVWILVLPLVWCLWLDKQRMSWSPPLKGGFGVAVLSGVVVSLVIFAGYYGFGKNMIEVGHVKDMASKIGLDKKWLYVFSAIYWITVNSVLEEYVWRWFVFRKFEVLFGGIAAILLSAFFFTIHHFFALSVYFALPINLICCFGVFIGGGFWSWMYLKYCSIWPGYVSHAIVDIAVFAIGYVLFFIA